jgi:hypothetical protein
MHVLSHFYSKKIMLFENQGRIVVHDRCRKFPCCFQNVSVSRDVGNSESGITALPDSEEITGTSELKVFFSYLKTVIGMIQYIKPPARVFDS